MSPVSTLIESVDEESSHDRDGRLAMVVLGECKFQVWHLVEDPGSVGLVVSTTALNNDLSVVSASTLNHGGAVVSATAEFVVTATAFLGDSARWGVVTASSHCHLKSDDGDKMHEGINGAWTGLDDEAVGDLGLKRVFVKNGEKKLGIERWTQGNKEIGGWVVSGRGPKKTESKQGKALYLWCIVIDV